MIAILAESTGFDKPDFHGVISSVISITHHLCLLNMATDTYTAFYKSEPRIYGVLNEPKEHMASIGLLSVRETFELNANDHIRPGLGSYEVVIEATVVDDREFFEFQGEAFSLAQCLDRLWTYATGMPLSVLYQGRSIYAYEYLQPPKGWTSNLNEVNDQLKAKAERSISVVGSTNIMWQWLPRLPLATVLSGREQLLTTSDPIHSLIEHHYDALTATDFRSKLFSLAKGLEIVRAMLPGKTDKAKASTINSEVAKSLRLGFGDLFNIANNRREIRHIIKDPKSKALHPKMSQHEKDSFSHDADVIIRAVVANELDIPNISISDQEPPLRAKKETKT